MEVEGLNEVWLERVENYFIVESYLDSIANNPNTMNTTPPNHKNGLFYLDSEIN